MCPSLPISELGSDAWNADAYDVVSLAYRIANAVHSTTASYMLSRKLWQLDKRLKQIQDPFYQTIKPSAVVELPPRDRVEAGVRAIKELHASFQNLANGMQTRGLQNQSRLAAPLNSARQRMEDLLDIAEAVELSLDQTQLDEMFREPLEELRDGKTLGIESII